MDTVSSKEMLETISNLGGGGFIHRFQSNEDIISLYNSLNCNKSTIGISVGINNCLELIDLGYKNGCNLFLIDVAYGHSKIVKDAIKSIKDYNKDIQIIAGNIATPQSALDLISWGADGLRVGIGGGSACTTRINTGVGIPMITCIKDISLVANTKIPIICDGGIRTSGDVSKAIGAGASTVMLGGLLAGTTEAAGEIIREGNFGNEVLYKRFRGMASYDTKINNNQEVRNVEGVSMLVLYKGDVTKIINDISDGLRSAMSYVGAKNINEYHELVEFIQITGAGLIEAKPHGKYK
jgi:IMP dehydrogenase